MRLFTKYICNQHRHRGTPFHTHTAAVSTDILADPTTTVEWRRWGGLAGGVGGLSLWAVSGASRDKNRWQLRRNQSHETKLGPTHPLSLRPLNSRSADNLSFNLTETSDTLNHHPRTPDIAIFQLVRSFDHRMNRRRRSSVNFRGHDIFAQKYVWKINKMPEFYMILVLACGRSVQLPISQGRCILRNEEFRSRILFCGYFDGECSVNYTLFEFRNPQSILAPYYSCCVNELTSSAMQVTPIR